MVRNQDGVPSRMEFPRWVCLMTLEIFFKLLSQGQEMGWGSCGWGEQLCETLPYRNTKRPHCLTMLLGSPAQTSLEIAPTGEIQNVM